MKMGSSEDHFTYAMQLVTSTSLTMVLLHTIKLEVLKTIAEAGPDARLSACEIVSRLSIVNQDAPGMLDRMLRLLASYSVVTCTQRDNELGSIRVYGLAPVAKYFIPNEDGACLGAFMEMYQDDILMQSWSKLKNSVLEGGIPFDKVYGMHVFEYPAVDARFNNVFNNAMVNHTTIVIKELLKCYHGFENLKQLVDVGGGLGITLNMIVLKHPTVKGVNFDLPHVIRHAPVYPGTYACTSPIKVIYNSHLSLFNSNAGIEHIGGDMFQEVPHGDAIFMKWILHDWSDVQCVKLLKNCYNALPIDGKVIVVEAVLPFLSDTSSSVKATTHLDAMMMTQNTGGKERTDEEFLALAKDAGFGGIRKSCFVCNFWVMEFYK